MVGSLHFVGLLQQYVVLLFRLLLLGFDLFLQLSNFKLFLLSDILGLIGLVFLALGDFSLQLLDLLLNLVALCLLDKDDLTVLNLW